MTSSTSRMCVAFRFRVVRDIHRVIMQVYVSLVLSGLGVMAVSTTSYQFHGVADRMVHRAPSMWKHLWVHRRSLLHNPALNSEPTKLTTLPSETIITYPANLSEQLDPNSTPQELQSGSSDRLVIILLMYGWAGLYKMRSVISHQYGATSLPLDNVGETLRYPHTIDTSRSTIGSA